MTTETKFWDAKAKWSGKGQVDIRCGGHGVEHVGETVYAMSKAGHRQAVRLIELVEDYGRGDVCTYRVEFAD